MRSLLLLSIIKDGTENYRDSRKFGNLQFTKQSEIWYRAVRAEDWEGESSKPNQPGFLEEKREDNLKQHATTNSVKGGKILTFLNVRKKKAAGFSSRNQTGWLADWLADCLARSQFIK